MNATRRGYLAAVGAAGATTATAGCFGVGQSRSVQIPEITISNQHEDSHDVHVLVVVGDEIVIWRSREVQPAHYEDGRLERMTGGTWRVNLDEPRPYRVLARLDDVNEWDSFEPGRVGDCIRVEYEVDRNANLVSIYARAEC